MEDMMRIDRRDALKLMTAGGIALTLSPVDLLAATPDLAVINGIDPAANVKAAIKALGGMSRFVSKGDKVVIKPNMGFGTVPLRTATTEPKVVRAIAEGALDAGAKQVLVFDNPCHKPKIVLEKNGIKKELAGLDDTFVFLINDEKFFAEVPIPKGVALKKQMVARDILECDSLIAVPVAKSHAAAKVTFGLKGWMGVVRKRGYWHVWVDLHQAIADFATLMKPKLTILDATRALITKGPGGPGKVLNLKTIIAGVDPVAVDAYGVTIAPWGNKEYKPEQIPHIVKAANLGVGTYNLAGMNIFKRSI